MDNITVPVVFALGGDTVWLVVDEKPKRHRRLQRLVNVEVEPRVSLLVDSYDEDWAACGGFASTAERGSSTRVPSSNARWVSSSTGIRKSASSHRRGRPSR